MRLLDSNDFYAMDKLSKQKGESLWVFVDSEKSNFIDDFEKAEIKNFLNKISIQFHTDGNFFSTLKEIFTQDEVCYLKEGQEDKGAIAFNNSVIIVRHSDFGVAFNVVQSDDSEINQENWINYQRMLSGLKLGFINPKDFHLMKSFDNMNSELKLKDSIKERKVKI